MYKTAMRVMMIGMVAMLGVEAEAHYMYVSGRYYYHSIGCYAEIGTRFPPNRWEVECQVNATRVELLCPDGSTVTLNLDTPVSLSAHVQKSAGKKSAEVLVDDSSLLNLGACAPERALVRNMVGTVTIYMCNGTGKDPCSSRLKTSTAMSTCSLPEGYSIYDYSPPDPEFPWQFTCNDLPLFPQHNN
ncbi:MAG: hypothetical protein USCGTAYLOR_00002 [Chromatiales bacterium USCg_Taylor]|nr:MAG: hypothetical protein USCGTAYLOR_00002 [Chromatiales bacterium USCg_Taylor]